MYVALKHGEDLEYVYYKYTRHNTGFEVIDKLSYDHNINMNKNKFSGICGEGIIGGEKVMLLKPLTYMNLSGN